ncbi:hypothetical protein CAC42_197 [Sphaceloma murrayae]|uniref:Uncharacterized protein n=1 Tax=Sphaceloma murrayae TaxID=2082308 RepID=A0A2K1QNN3_9PEZI|nr:hypothetical protein CAC42_197 [Sphaceloma murrayae]
MDLARGILRGAFAQPDGELGTVSKEDLTAFCNGLDQLVSTRTGANSPESINSTAWVLNNVAASPNRTKALGRYLIKVVENEAKRAAASHVTYSETGDPRRARRSQSNGSAERAWYSALDAQLDSDISAASAALAVLQLADVWLKATGLLVERYSTGERFDRFAAELLPTCSELLRQASPETGRAALEFHETATMLLATWKAEATFDDLSIMKLREVARGNYRRWLRWLQGKCPDDFRKLQQSSSVHSSLLDMPDYHGSHRDAWHQQPTGSMIGLIQGSKPISSEDMRPLHVSGTTMDPHLLDVVDQHVEEAERIYSMPKASPYLDDGDVQLNSLGFRVKRDALTGKRRVVETYYGHTIGHVEHLKRRKTNAQPPIAPAMQPRGPSTTAVPPPQATSTSRSYTTASESRSPDNATPSVPPPPSQGRQFVPPPPAISSSSSSPFSIPPPPPPSAGSPPAPFQLPPRPPNWHGPWPPPPPLPPGGSMQGHLPFVPPPPPPHPPPPSHSPSDSQYGARNGDGYNPPSNAHGRGGYGGGRGRGGYGARGRW